MVSVFKTDFSVPAASWKIFFCCGVAFVATAFSAAIAVEPSPLAGKQALGEGMITGTEQKSVLDQIWDLPVLYDNEDNPVIQKISLIGRYSGQWNNTTSNRGEDSDWLNRLFRAGPRIEFLDNFVFQTELNLKRIYSRPGRFVRSFDNLFVEWRPSDDFSITLGKIKPKITHEYYINPSKRLFFETSLLVAQTVPAKMYALQFSGHTGGFDYRLAGYTTGLDLDWLTPEFNGGYSLLASLGRDVSEATNVRLDYLFNDPAEQDFATRDTRHLVSLNTRNEFDRWGLNTDLLFARVRRKSDNLWGISLMPYYNITEELQFILRYHYAGSDGPDGIRSRLLYERLAIDEDGSGDRGDGYHSIYAGFNYYIYGHKLKLMTGLEYGNLNGVDDNSDWDGWTYLAGVRLYF